METPAPNPISPAGTSTASHPHAVTNPLPHTLTSLVARTVEIEAIARSLRDPTIRMLTLTGPGGVGKTRLAIAVAEQVADAFQDGIVYVDLAPVRDPSLVLRTIAARFSLRELGSGILPDRLVSAIAERHLLLVIDNFEQVVIAARDIQMLLELCPALVLLVTSRIRLRISGEHEFPVAPLPLSESSDPSQSGAVQLFIERARTVSPGYSPSPDTVPVLVEIVRRVDGLPLAIELAAARIKTLPPAALLDRMERRLPLLSGGWRDLPLRQQTMRDTIGWSYDLLDTPEQALFRRLGIFVGGFTLDAVEAISKDMDPTLDVIDGITALIEHSLLQHVSESDGHPRYKMLETVSEYARDRLDAAQETDTVCRHHAEFYLALAEAGETGIVGPHQTDWLYRLDHEKDNIRTALHWALQHEEIDTATRLTAALWLFWRRRGYLSEGRTQIDQILALPPGSGSVAARCSVRTGAGVLAMYQGDYELAIQHCHIALDEWRERGDQKWIGRTLLCLASIARYRDDYASARTFGEESLTAFRAIDDRWGIGRVMNHLGMIAWVQGRRAEGTAYLDDALKYLRQVEDTAGIFEVLLEMGKGACDEGNLDRATTLFEESLVLSESMGDHTGRGAVLTELAVVAQHSGDYDRATILLQQAKALAQQDGDRRQLAYLAAHLGDTAVARGEIGPATGYYAEALTHFLPMGNRVGIAQTIGAIAQCAALRGQTIPAIRLLGSTSALFHAIGATPPPNHDPATAAATLRPKLSPAVFARVWQEGAALLPADSATEALAMAAELAAEPSIQDSPAPAPDSPALQFGLTPREIEVLALLQDGLSDREIADILSISERTAGNHVQHAMQKIGVPSRTAAAIFALRHGLI